MKMNKALAIVAVAMGLMNATAAWADGSYSIFPNNPFFDENGQPIANGTWVMALDVNQNGYQGVPYDAQAPNNGLIDNSSSWLWDPADLLMSAPGGITNGSAFPFGLISEPFPAGYNAGVDPYYLLWFDKPFDALAAGPGAGVNYGVVLGGLVSTDNPANELSFPTLGLAQFVTVPTVVPEPISALLAALGGGALFARRRFMKKS